MFHSVQVGAIDVNIRAVRFSWRGIGATPVFFIREAVDNVLQGFLRVGEKGAVVSKQQLSD